MRAANAKADKIAREFHLDAGTQHLDGDAAGSSSAVIARCTCAIDAAATDSPKIENISSSGRPNSVSIAAFATSSGNGGRLILQAFERACDVLADQVGTRGEHLAELDIGGAEALQRAREPDARRHVGVGLARTAEEELRDLERERRALGIFARHQRVVTRKHASRVQQAFGVADGSEHR
jgi:hypothetical protein